MSDKLRVIRDSIDTGDDVLVVHHGRKPRKARVCEVMRSALRVRYADVSESTLHTVLLKDVRRVDEEEVVTKAPLPQRPSRVQLKQAASVEAVSAEPGAAIVAVAVVTAQASAGEPPLVVGGGEEMSAWVDMGKEVRARIDCELEANATQVAALREDALALQAEIERLTRVSAVLTARRERIETVLTW